VCPTVSHDEEDIVQPTAVLGAIVADLIFVLCSLIFVARVAGRAVIEHWLGLVLTLAVAPLTYLLLSARGRPPLYYVQLALMIAFLVLELVWDYVLKVPFRQARWTTIIYVTLFFAATGGMIGVATRAGRAWGISAIVLFLVMAILAFTQHGKTGL
jgi:hypothetical protein